jgi:hypothetical protein
MHLQHQRAAVGVDHRVPLAAMNRTARTTTTTSIAAWLSVTVHQLEHEAVWEAMAVMHVRRRFNPTTLTQPPIRPLP